jgi:hypothetical protein
MSTTNRIVKYNEELFKIPSGTKKRRDKPPIKIKPTTTKTIKRKILDELRRTQQQQMNALTDAPSPSPAPAPPSDSHFETDFKNSVDYMQTFIDNHKKETTVKLNSTIKEKKQHPIPTYGCLKNGSLPTYRNIHGTTIKNRNSPMVYTNQSNAAAAIGNPPMVYTNQSNAAAAPYENPPMVYTNQSNAAAYGNPPMVYTNQSNAAAASYENPPMVYTNQSNTDDVIHIDDFKSTPTISERIKSPSEILLKEKTKQKSKVKPMDKHKRQFLRRTYHVGKDKYKPKVGVLLPNKTIRKRVTTSSYLLKQTPIEEIRKFLLKKGFIKVGSSAPNDVLRKMYESIQMIDGEINNHNSENLLHNFFNHK